MPSHLIVGAYYRKPAPAILRTLAVGTPLILRAEPENPYDVNAIAVWIDTTRIGDHADVSDAIAAESTRTLGEIKADLYFQLGYIKKEEAADMRGAGFPDDEDVFATFTCTARGVPLARTEDW